MSRPTPAESRDLNLRTLARIARGALPNAGADTGDALEELVAGRRIARRIVQQLSTTQAVADYHDAIDELKAWLEEGDQR